jgi:hypothetical protein
MSAKSYTLTVFKIIMFKVDINAFSPMPKEDNKVLKAKKTIFLSRYGMCFSIFLILSETGTCLQNLISTRGVKH